MPSSFFNQSLREAEEREIIDKNNNKANMASAFEWLSSPFCMLLSHRLRWHDLECHLMRDTALLGLTTVCEEHVKEGSDLLLT